jgi:hypothetical protein
MNMHVKLHKTEIYKNSVIYMGSKIYNNLPEFIKEIDDYKAFKKELKLFFFSHFSLSGRIFIFLAFYL